LLGTGDGAGQPGGRHRGRQAGRLDGDLGRARRRARGRRAIRLRRMPVGTRNKVLLDRLVANPSAWALSVAARSLGRVVNRSRRTDPESVKTIVVAKLLGMGSII